MLTLFYNQIRKDFLWDISYKITFFSQFVAIFFTFITFLFISKTFSETESIFLQDYQNSYLAFSVVGIAVLDMVSNIARSLPTQIREAQALGYLDNLLNSRINPFTIFMASLAYPTIKSLFRIVVYLLLIINFTNFTLSMAQFFNILLLLFITAIPFYALSLLGCAFVLNFKQADPINIFLSFIISIFSGIFYPTTVLPNWMQTISEIIPTTFFIDLIRYAFLNIDFNISEYFIQLTFLVIFFNFLFFISVIILNIVIRKVKKDGTSGSY